MPKTPKSSGKPPAQPNPSPLPEPAHQCAVEILETMPVIMGSLRQELRGNLGNGLTMPQFRVLAFLGRRKAAASLSQVAQHLGLGAPSASKMADGMVNAGWIERRSDSGDRRRISLVLSAAGNEALQATRERAQKHLAGMLAPLSAAERTRLVKAMRSLRPLFPECASHCS